MNQAFSRIWIIIITIIILFGGGIFIWQFQQPAEEKLELPGTEKPKIEIQEGKINEALLICAKTKDAEKRDICTGIINGNLEACEILPEWEKVDCYVSLGRRIGDSSICERFNSEGLKYECLARLTGDYEKCKKASLELMCYYDVAIIREDSLVCRNIEIKDRISESFFNKCLALLEKSHGYCSEIPQEITRDDCYVHVAMLNNDSSICQKSDRYKDLCQSMVGRNTESLDCKTGGYCEFFAGFTGDDSVCQKMVAGDNCYYNAAMGLIGIYPPEAPRGW